jgi:hypothetical protein
LRAQWILRLAFPILCFCVAVGAAALIVFRPALRLFPADDPPAAQTSARP